ncbi:hypothetical protein [Martelella lutilitoris]|uniref:hypothetical protein n=1 Tax=Martelella lutilitoris TaxID=2583532 RepID=UPI0016516CA5|nr:hypothetical protein [Martelella lutilitoris]
MAQASLRLVAQENPPAQFFLGNNASNLMNNRLERMKQEIAVWDELNRSAGG